MTIAKVKAQLTAFLARLNSGSGVLSLLMPAYGIEQDPAAAQRVPSIDELFTAEELRAMARRPELVREAHEDLRSYIELHWWDGYVRDSRYAYVGGTHDFEGTRRTFQQFREERRRASASRKR